MIYTKEQIDKVNALDIIEVAERLEMPIKRQGRFSYTNCLWHNDDSPSLQLGGKDEFRSQCHCYVCNKSWGVISLVMEKLGKNFVEAMEWLDIRPSPALRAPTSVGSGNFLSSVGPQPHRVAAVNTPFAPSMGSSSYGTIEELRGYVSLQNALAKCLLYRFPMDTVARVTLDYYLGVDYDVCHYDHTLFPSIDKHQRVHHIKAQGYVTAPSSPQFGHSTKGDTYWVGQRLLEGKDVDTDCLFGEHLLPRYPDRVVVLVESPKNAVVGACQYPELLWVATGNKGMLKRPLLEALCGRKVIVMPDRDAVAEWSEKIAAMQDIATFQMSSFCEYNGEAEDEKLDVADMIFRPSARPSPADNVGTLSRFTSLGRGEIPEWEK